MWLVKESNIYCAEYEMNQSVIILVDICFAPIRMKRLRTCSW